MWCCFLNVGYRYSFNWRLADSHVLMWQILPDTKYSQLSSYVTDNDLINNNYMSLFLVFSLIQFLLPFS